MMWKATTLNRTSDPVYNARIWWLEGINERYGLFSTVDFG